MMTQEERLTHLLQYFCGENPSFVHAIPTEIQAQKDLLRGFMNKRPPEPIEEAILKVQDDYLQEELSGKVVSLDSLSPVSKNIYLWQGDITTLDVDAIVNAANRDLLGCFHPCHKCIDNAIHTFSGIQLRLACHEIMEAQGKPESTGQAKITPAFNLPCRYVIHTVGPIVRDRLEVFHKEGLRKCYKSCLQLALEQGLNSIAFCCISTGEFHFPQDIACDIAVETVSRFLEKNPDTLNVVFNVFKEEDLLLYEKKLS